MATRRLDIPLTLDGRVLPSETLQTLDGPYGLAFSTTIASEALGLHSTYQGAPNSDTTAISHVVLAAGTASTEILEVESGELPIDRQRHRCLYHHLQRLQDLAVAASCGNLAAVDIAADAVALP